MKNLKLIVLIALLAMIPIVAIAWIGWDNVYGVFAEPPADVSSTQRSRDTQIAFEYPGNWKMRSERSKQAGVEVRSRHIESPGSAMVIVQTFQPSVDLPLDEYVRGFVSGFDKELADSWGGVVEKQGMDRQAVTRSLLGASRDAIQLKVTLGALQEKIPFTIEIVSVKQDSLTLVVVSMIPDDGLDAAKPGVDLVRNSLALASGG